VLRYGLELPTKHDPVHGPTETQRLYLYRAGRCVPTTSMPFSVFIFANYTMNFRRVDSTSVFVAVSCCRNPRAGPPTYLVCPVASLVFHCHFPHEGSGLSRPTTARTSSTSRLILPVILSSNAIEANRRTLFAADHLFMADPCFLFAIGFGFCPMPPYNYFNPSILSSRVGSISAPDIPRRTSASREMTTLGFVVGN
jgi:hypothetical protein